MEDRKKSQAALDTAISKFLKEVEDKKITEPNKELLKKYFNANELQALWKRLEKARGSQPATIQEAWAGLKDLGAGRAEKERYVALMTFMQKGDDDDTKWADHLIEIKEEITKSKVAQRKIQKFYKGELEVIHGKSEAARFIANGKFKKTTDEDGDEVYIKNTDSIILEKGRKTTAGGSRHSALRNVNYIKLDQVLKNQISLDVL